MQTYTIRVSKDYLAFSSAHFIVFRGNVCERLHGHNYRVAVELEGELDAHYLVFDFIELKKILRALTDELDHRLLVPLESRDLAVEIGERTVSIRYEDKTWSVPRGDCALLPVANTTAELLARYLAHRVARAMKERFDALPHRLRIEVEESPGQAAFYDCGREELEAAASGS